MRTPLLSVSGLALVAVLGSALVAPIPAAAARTGPDLPDVRAEALIRVTGHWSGHISFGMHTSGRVRTARPLPLDLHLARTSCDMTGCMTTEIVVDPSSAVPGFSRVAGQLTGASLGKTTVAITIRRVVNGVVVAEHPSTMALHVRAQRSGPVIKRTTLTQGPSGEILTIARTAQVRATVVVGEEMHSGAGEISRTKIVGQGPPRVLRDAASH
jgi:hypothetical protein